MRVVLAPCALLLVFSVLYLLVYSMSVCEVTVITHPPFVRFLDGVLRDAVDGPDSHGPGPAGFWHGPIRPCRRVEVNLPHLVIVGRDGARPDVIHTHI